MGAKRGLQGLETAFAFVIIDNRLHIQHSIRPQRSKLTERIGGAPESSKLENGCIA